MLHTLRLKNWRSFRDETITLAEPGAESGGLKIFIGANASGKSNVFDALRLLSQALKDDLEIAITRRGGLENVHFQNAPLDENIVIEMRVELPLPVDNESRFLGYDLEIGGSENGIPGPAKERFERTYRGRTETFFIADWGEGIYTQDEISTPIKPEEPGVLALSSPVYRENSPEILSLQDYISIWQFLNVDLNAIRAPQRPERARRLESDASNLVNTLRTLSQSASQKFENIQENLSFMLGHVQAVSTKVESSLVTLQIREQIFADEFDERTISDGTLRILAILTALEMMPENGLLAIEEPEHGIHPLLFGYLIDIIREYVEDSPRQVLLTTHSTELVDASNRPEEVLVIERDDSGASVVHLLDAGELTKWLDDFRLGEVWRMRRIGGVPA